MEKESLKIEEKDTFISIDIRLNTRVCKLAYKTSKDIIGRRFQSIADTQLLFSNGAEGGLELH